MVYLSLARRRTGEIPGKSDANSHRIILVARVVGNRGEFISLLNLPLACDKVVITNPRPTLRVDPVAGDSFRPNRGHNSRVMNDNPVNLIERARLVL